MYTKSKKRKYIDPEGFYIARKRAGLTMMKTADLLDVDIRTIRNWENGSTRIPYSAFRLMRMAGGYSLLGKEWDGWAVWEGKLFSPAGRAFEPHELQYVSHYISMARLFIKSGENINPKANIVPKRALQAHIGTASPMNATIERGKASGATAPAGASPCHDAIVITVDFSQQKKTPEHRKSQNQLMFGRFSSYRKAAANEAYYG